MGKKQFETLSNHPNHQSAILTQPISPDTNRSRFISTFDWKYLTGHSDLITFILCDMTWKTKRSVWLWESLGGMWAEREADTAQDCAELSQRTNLQDLYVTSTIYGFARNYKTAPGYLFSLLATMGMDRRRRASLALTLNFIALILAISALTTSYWCDGNRKVVKPFCTGPVTGKQTHCIRYNSSNINDSRLVQYVWETGEDKFVLRKFHTGIWFSCEQNVDLIGKNLTLNLTPKQ